MNRALFHIYQAIDFPIPMIQLIHYAYYSTEKIFIELKKRGELYTYIKQLNLI